MEDSNVTTKKELSLRQKSLLWFFILSQIVITLRIAYLYSESHMQGTWASFSIIFIFAPIEVILTIFGIIFSSIYLAKYKSKYLTLSVLIISILGFPLWSLSIQNAISPIFNPITKKASDIEYEKESREHDRKTQVIYESLLKEFSTPQKVVGIEGPRILLEKGYVLDVFRSLNISSDKISEFEIWVNNNLVGKNVIVHMGSKEESGPLKSCTSGMDSSVMDIRNKFRFPVEKSGICDSIDAAIYFDNTEIGTLFKSSK